MPVLKFVALCIHSDELPAPLAPHPPPLHLSPLYLSISLTPRSSSPLLVVPVRHPVR